MSLTTYAIVTGASRGLGLALAQGLIQAGARILTLSRSHNAELESQAAQAGCSLRQIQVDLVGDNPEIPRIVTVPGDRGTARPAQEISSVHWVALLFRYCMRAKMSLAISFWPSFSYSRAS